MSSGGCFGYRLEVIATLFHTVAHWTSFLLVWALLLTKLFDNHNCFGVIYLVYLVLSEVTSALSNWYLLSSNGSTVICRNKTPLPY